MTATTKRKRRSESAPKLLDLDMDELADIIERAGTAAFTDEDRQKLRQTIETLAYLQRELGNKNATLARLRSLLGIQNSEKTKRVLKHVIEAASRDQGGDASDGDEASAEPRKAEKAKGHGRNGAHSYQGAERIVVGHGSLSSGDLCPQCPSTNPGILYTQGRPSVVVRLVGKPPVQATVYELERLRCNLCGKVFTAKLPAGAPDEKYDATAAAMIALLKYGSGFPFNRLARLEGDAGIPLPASTQWDIVSTAADELTAVHGELLRQAAQGRVLYNDDTSMRVLTLRKAIDELVESGETKRTGIFSTGIVSELAGGHRVALYFTGRQHAGENIADLLTMRDAASGPPMQMCDGLEHNEPKEFETIVSNCLVHARRKFVEVVTSFPDQCRRVIETLRDVYRTDAKAKELGLSADQRLRLHHEHSKPLMDGLKDWMLEQFEEKLVEPNSGLGGAIKYMQKRWTKLTRFLREPGAPLDNNVCERALKKAILHRKNGLFYRTENGARVGDLFMALIHTAELVDANPFDYLTALLRNNDEVHARPDQWLPWNYRDTMGAGSEDIDVATTSA